MDPLIIPTIDLSDLPDGHAVYFGIPSTKTQVLCKSKVFDNPSKASRKGTLGQIFDDPNLEIAYSIKFRTADQARILAASLIKLADGIEEDNMNRGKNPAV